MKKKFILLPMFLLVLAACGKTSSSETPTSSAPGTSVPGTSEVTTSEDPITSEVEESSDDLPPPPPSSSVQEAVLTTIEEARKVADGTEVTVEGVITAIYGMASEKHGVIIQEGDYAITLPFVDKAITAELEVGNVIQAKGKRQLFHGLVQLSNSAITFKAAEGPEIVPLTLTEADWTIENLQTKDARWVKVEGLKYVGGVVNLDANSPITVKLGDTELPIYMSRYIDMAEKEAIKTKIESIKSTDTITFVGPVGFYDTPQLNPVNAATITIVEGEDPVGPVLPTSLTFTPATAELAPGETFATTLVKAPSDATLEGLTYTSADEAVATVSDTGVITAVASGTTTITAQVGEVKATFVVNVPIIDDTITLLNSFNFLDGGDSGNTGYANTDVKTNVSYADNNPGGVTGTTEWEADYSNLGLNYGTRLGGKLESEVQTDAETPWANIKTLFTFEAEIKKVEILGSVYFGSNNITGLYLQYSADGSTWNTVGELATPAELSKSAADNPGISISFDDLSIPANSFLRFGVGLTAATSNSGFQFTGIQVYTAAN